MAVVCNRCSTTVKCLVYWCSVAGGAGCLPAERSAIR